MSDLEQRRLDGVRAVVAEQGAQLAKWGVQKHPDLCRRAGKDAERRVKDRVDRKSVEGSLTWQDIFEEEWVEALAADTLEDVRTELVQCAAVLLSWVNDIDRRGVDGDILIKED